MKMVLKLVFVSAFLFQMMGCVKTEVGERCDTPHTCPCCEGNKCNMDRLCMIACKDGYWGSKCYHKCPSNCIRCGREFGITPHHTYQKCYKCADGFYNGTGITNCSTPCQVTCSELLCDATNGSCLNGCINENINGDKCEKCIKGKFGTNCSLSCPANCNHSVCSRTEGKCTYGCVSNVFEGDKCNTCVAGKYGEHCDMPCPENCRDNWCFEVNGTCTTGCKGNFAGKVCNRCKDGFFGNNCTKRCLSSCLHGICDSGNGHCELGCIVGYFSSMCNKICSSKCLDSRCTQDKGKCEGCYKSYYGDYCDQICGKCENGTCHQNSSQCLYGCVGRYSGYNCMNEMQDESASNVIPAVVGSISTVFVIAAIVIIGQWIIRRRRIQASRYQEQGQGYENTLVDIGLHNYTQLNIKDSDRENVYDKPSDKPAENEYVNTAIK